MSNVNENNDKIGFEFNSEQLKILLDNDVSIEEKNSIIKDIKIPSAEDVIMDLFLTLQLIDNPEVPIDEQFFLKALRETSYVWLTLKGMQKYYNDFGSL